MAEHNAPRLESKLLAAWLAVNLCIGILIVHAYGVSFDEPGYYKYAASSLEAYKSLFGRLYEPYYGPSNLPYYGPVFITLVAAAIKLIQVISPSVLIYDVWHFSYFLLFQLTGLCLYAMTRRWFSSWTAWSVLILFITQPLLWGHAFINPKDVPFMFFFVLSIFTGFRLADRLSTDSKFVSLKPPLDGFLQSWNKVDLQKRKTFISLILTGAALILAVIALGNVIFDAAGQVVRFFYEAEMTSWAGQVFRHIAPQASNVSLTNYVGKAQGMLLRLGYGLFAAGLASLAIYLGLLTTNTSAGSLPPKIWEWVKDGIARARNGLLAARFMISLNFLTEFARETLQAFISFPVLLAGVALGLTISVRALGPLAGLIVILYLVVTVKQRTLPVLLAYLAWASIVTYLTWPFLWLAPIPRFLESMSLMTNFPWDGRVLFDGHFYRADGLPWTYLPALLNIQLTEPFLLLFYPALGILLWRLFHEQIRIDLLLYIGLGFVIPVAALIWLHSPLYDNFRQLLFLLPALFLLAGFALEALFNRLKRIWVRLVLIIAIGLPGIYSAVQLHPYQYVYYNSLVGGVRGAYGRYEMDYWRTSYRELALQVNQFAPKDARIIFIGLPDTFRIYARPDLVLERGRDTSFDVNGEYDYAVIPSRWKAEDFYPAARLLIVIEREGAILSAVKLVRGASQK